MSIRFLLIENDSAARHSILAHLADRCDFEMLDEAAAASDLLQPDVIFADFDLLQGTRHFLASGHHKPIVVFLATHRHFALQAFDLGAVDYLLKPIRQDRLEICLTRIHDQLDRRITSANTPSVPVLHQRRIEVTNGKRTHILEASEIDWIAAAGDYSEIHVASATHLLREPLSALLNRLPADVFCRIHRSFVVNLSKVSGFKALRNQDFLVRMKDRAILRASRTFSEEFRTAIAQQSAYKAAPLAALAMSQGNEVNRALYA